MEKALECGNVILVEVVEDQAADGFHVLGGRALEVVEPSLRDVHVDPAAIIGGLFLDQEPTLFHACDLVGGARAIPSQLRAQVAQAQVLIWGFRKGYQDREFGHGDLPARLKRLVHAPIYLAGRSQ